MAHWLDLATALREFIAGHWPWSFHFLRPWWLAATLPVLWLTWMVRRRQQASCAWQALIPAQLLTHLLEKSPRRRRSLWICTLLLSAGLLAIMALAGPSWRQHQSPAARNTTPLAFVVNLSDSMLAGDLKPDRISWVKRTLTDLLHSREDGVTALLVYAGDSHVVAPLTDDSDTLINLLRALHPSIMPLPGQRADKGIAQAVSLMAHVSGAPGSLVLVTDSVDQRQADAIEHILKYTEHRLSVLGVGSTGGAPIPTQQGRFVHDEAGAIMISRLQKDRLRQLAHTNGGYYRDASMSAEQIAAVISAAPAVAGSTRSQRTLACWHDEGHWLLLLLLPLAAMGFRRGWVLPSLVLWTLAHSQDSRANRWQELWYTPDQRAQSLLQQGKNTAAAACFHHQGWKAEALDRSGQHSEAAALLAQQKTPHSDYNRGNALARSGALREAIQAYDLALAQDPDLEQARTNRDIVQKMLKQQKRKPNSPEQKKKQNQKQRSQEPGPDKQKSPPPEKTAEQPDAGSPSLPDGSNDDSPAGNSQQSPEQKQITGKPAEQESQTRPAQPENPDSHQRPDAEKNSPLNRHNQKHQSLPDPVSQQHDAWLRRIPDDPGGLLRRKFKKQQEENRSLQQRKIMGAAL